MNVVKRCIALFFVLVFCASCSLFSGLRKRKFTFTENGASQTLGLLVPKRYASVEKRTDSAGNQFQTYRYKSGALLYIIQTTDTLTQFQPIDTANHNPLPHPYGGLMYKALDSTGRFWREVRTDSFRFGYRNVPFETEYYFDTAVNFAATRQFRK